jgi:DNA-binding IclR family transcriptional regulator
MKRKERQLEQEGPPSRYTIHSVEKALDVIEALSEYGTLSLIELAEVVKQPKSSLFRIILTLEQRGFISRSEEDGKYCMGIKQLSLTKNLLERSTLRASALSEMHKLVDKYGDTVNLCLLVDGEILYLEIIEGTYALRMTDRVGSKSPFHATAAGKAIVSTLSVEEVSRLLEQKDLTVYTPNTITDKTRFVNELEKINRQGYAVDNQEIVMGARCIAAPIFNMFGRVEGAISLSGAVHRFPDEQITAISEDIKSAASAISLKLGHLNGELN